MQVAVTACRAGVACIKPHWAPGRQHMLGELCGCTVHLLKLC